MDTMANKKKSESELAYDEYVQNELDGRFLVSISVTVAFDNDRVFTIAYDKVIASFNQCKGNSISMILRNLGNEVRFWAELKHIINFNAALGGALSLGSFKHDGKIKEEWMKKYENEDVNRRAEVANFEHDRIRHVALAKGKDDQKMVTGPRVVTSYIDKKTGDIVEKSVKEDEAKKEG